MPSSMSWVRGGYWPSTSPPTLSHSNMVERLSVFKADTSGALYPQAWAAELPSLHKPPLLLASSHHCCQLPGDSSLLVPCFFSFPLPIDCPLETGKNLSSSPRQNWAWHPHVPLKCPWDHLGQIRLWVSECPCKEGTTLAFKAGKRMLISSQDRAGIQFPELSLVPWLFCVYFQA